MARSGKWLDDAKPAQPLTEVAAEALRRRLSDVWHFAPLAARKHEANIEYVHQLRVATRRALAAIELFSDLLPKGKTKWVRIKLKAIRLAAGDARDLDVLGKKLSENAKKKKNRHLRTIAKQVAVQRRKAQKLLVAGIKDAKQSEFNERSLAMVKKLKWRGEEREPTYGEAARPMLRPLVDKFFRAAEADLSDIAALHRMRISGKQLRYAMELLAGAFDDSFRGELYATFESVQEELGEINDHATAITLFGDWAEQSDDRVARDAFTDRIADEGKLLEEKAQAFRDSWTAKRMVGLKQGFANALNDNVDVSRSADTIQVS